MKTSSLILFLTAIFFSCQKEVSYTNGVTSLPILTTAVVSSITNTTAISGGNISDDGGSPITARGVCWSTSSSPVATGNHTLDGTGAGTFTSNITGLTASTLYYVRAYATNTNGTSYGNVISFTTSATTGALPAVTTATVSSITITTATSGGNVLNDGGSSVTARGICWGTSSNPVVTGSHTTDGAGLGAFTSSMTALTASTTYYVRAYATNTNGTAYGNEVSFTTSAVPGLPSVTTDVISYIASTTAAGGGNVLSDGGSPVTARGICWNTSTAPVAGGSHTTNGSGLGTFVSSMTSLTPATTYYVRAYATNANGTSYGNERTFNTPATSTPDVYTCGYEKNAAGKTVAKYWKNAVAYTLTDGTKDASATSIFVVGTDVYVCGVENIIASNAQAILWKNGVRTNLSLSSVDAVANSVFVSGTDVYVAGDEDVPGGNARAKYWKNGVSVSLPDGGSSTTNSTATALVASGSDIYASGTIYPTAPAMANPSVWTNGVRLDLPTPSSDFASGDALAVNGSDVYVAGYSTDFVTWTVKYWKNGVVTAMPAGPANIETRPSGIAIDGSDVYIAGWQVFSGTTSVVKLWKNGVASNVTDGTLNANGDCIKIFSNAVYIGGFEDNTSSINVAKYWKNGVATSLTDGTHDAEVLSIFVQ